MPQDFIAETYLNLNPDLRLAGVDPAAHYISHGRDESRIYVLPEITVSRGEMFDPLIETVLVVAHEASRTGAPILAYNLVKALSEKYNVVVLLLGDGVLSEAFNQTGATVVITPFARFNLYSAGETVGEICRCFDLKFALVNSVESRLVLPALAARFVPVVTLVHEFASYTRPINAFKEIFFWSNAVVFSAEITRKNAVFKFPELRDVSVEVLPQGKCILPAITEDDHSDRSDVVELREHIRPQCIAKDTLIVLGAGFVHMRKGVDIFIECASRVRRRMHTRNIRFVWIGGGFDPEGDPAYSAYLQDHLERADLIENVVFLQETAAIDAAFEEADLFLLSSRLDPLPNVAIDAMCSGLPVICFDKTTGIADFLKDAGLGAVCVADYLDTEDVATKICNFAISDDLVVSVGSRCRSIANQYFSMNKYVERLESLAELAQAQSKQESSDCQIILRANVLSAELVESTTAADHAVRRYVRGWASGVTRIRPFAGFSPETYLQYHGVSEKSVDPLADYLRSGRPQGIWSHVEHGGSATASV